VSYLSGTTFVAAGLVMLPWTLTLTAPANSELAVTARNQSDIGNLRCSITRVGQSEPLATDETEDAYGSVTCVYAPKQE
jgi:hypothetical protein